MIVTHNDLRRWSELANQARDFVRSLETARPARGW